MVRLQIFLRLRRRDLRLVRPVLSAANDSYMKVADIAPLAEKVKQGKSRQIAATLKAAASATGPMAAAAGPATVDVPTSSASSARLQ